MFRKLFKRERGENLMIHDLQNGRFEKKLLLSKNFICPNCFSQIIFLDDNSCYCPKESIKFVKINNLNNEFKDFYGNIHKLKKYSNNELRVLEVLLENHFSNVRSLSLLCRLRNDTVQHVLYRLIEKKLVYRKKVRKRYYYYIKAKKFILRTKTKREFYYSINGALL